MAGPSTGGRQRRHAVAVGTVRTQAMTIGRALRVLAWYSSRNPKEQS
jgi:hypothetical protein